MARASYVDSVSIALGIGPAPTLTVLANASPEPWCGLLRDHQIAFTGLTVEITQLCHLNPGLITVGRQASSEVALHLVGERQSYSPYGNVVAPRAMVSQFPGRATIIATSLADFLR